MSEILVDTVDYTITRESFDGGFSDSFAWKPGRQPVEQVNRAAILDAARQALATNRTFVALASPTNAQVVAQVKALTQQNIRLIRLALGQFEDVG